MSTLCLFPSPETIAKRIAASKKYKHSEETKKKMSDAKKGKKHSDETRAKMRESHKNISYKTRIKIRDAKIGVKQTPEHIANHATAIKGKKYSQEHCQNISKSLKGKYCGVNSSAWKGGVSYEPYCVLFNNEFKERVRENYGRKCVECGKEENGKKLSVHHVNFDKSSCCSDVKPLFVALCASCHAKTNYNREYWEERYTKLINEKYNGRCYLPKVIS